ncbi:MAG: DUF2461 domain-containing protein [Bacteroidota bacterium]
MITKAYASFFKELSKNNHKEWFHANKKRYENDVKAPFLQVLDEILPLLSAWDDSIPVDSKKALFRINRDIRFSKDKSPYILMMKAGFSPNGKKSELPGYYLGIDAEHVHVGGGLFRVSPQELKLVRHHISANTTAFLEILNNPDFKNCFGRLRGERAKRLDKEFKDAAQNLEYLYNKQFYAFAEFPLANFYGSNGLSEEILEHFREILPLNTFLNKAFE